MATKKIKKQTQEVNKKAKYENAPNTEENNKLRELLFRVYNDKEIARGLENGEISIDCLYDPHPNKDTGTYLAWDCLDGKTKFYLDSETGEFWGGDKGTEFELVGRRFYADNRELPLYFPRLTASKLEKCIKIASSD